MRTVPSDKLTTTTVKLPAKLRAEVQRIARAEGRTFGGQVRQFLGRAVGRRATAKREAAR